MTLAAGRLLVNRYRIEALLGSGGMGAVYRAYDTELQQAVAIKENIVVIPGIPQDVIEARRRQFEREAAMLASLHHPNIPGVLDHFTLPDSNQYLVMDYVDGEDMAQIIAQKGSLPEEEAIAWVGQVCDALEYLHSQDPPVIHRDVKPQNIKVTSHGQVFLVDFGIAKLGGVDSKTTRGALSVTPGFSPPEQYAMIGTDSRSDIYSLGATLYALLTGQVPPDSVSLQGGELELVPPRTMNVAVSLGVQQAVLKAMATRRSDRPQTVGEFWQMLHADQGTVDPKTVRLVTEARPVSRALKDRLAEAIVTGRNNLRWVLLVAGAFVILGATLASSLLQPSPQRVGNSTLLNAISPVLPTETATEAVAAVTPSPEAAAASTEVALQQVQLTSFSLAATQTAEALIATQRAADATATRQTATFDCDRLDFQVLQSPDDAQTVAAVVADVGFTWRVKNKAASPSCQWGQTGQEIQILRAALIGGQDDSGTAVKLKWIQADEYDLSLRIQLNPGSYTLGWRVFLPRSRSSDSPVLEARISVVSLTPRPTSPPSPTPTVTPCPTVTYACRCKEVCSGRDCVTVCDQCTRETCN